jgi:hypothetical protein
MIEFGGRQRITDANILQVPECGHQLKPMDAKKLYFEI